MNQTLILWALTSALLILAVVLLRAVFGRRMGAGLRYALWGLVLLRLLVPVQLFTVPVPALGRTQSVEAPRPSAVLVPAQTAGVPAVTGPLPDDVVMNVTTIPEPAAPHVVTLDVQKLLGGLWLCGSAVTAAVFLGSNLSFARRLRRVRQPLCSFSREKKNQKELQARFQLGDRPKLVPGNVADCLRENEGPLPLYVAEALPSPCLFGLFRPAVYVTPAAAADPDVLRHVLAHEATHYRHGDHIWNVLRCAALALHWWNPLVWLAAALSRRDCELACDEGALKRLGEEERFAYGRTLLSLIGARSRPADLLTCATTMTGDGKTVAQRVKRIAQAPKRWLWAAVAAVLLAGIVTVCAFGQAEPTQTPEQDPASDDVQLPAPEEAGSPTPKPEEFDASEPVAYITMENANRVEITGLDCESASWFAGPASSGLVVAGRRDLMKAETLGHLSISQPRFLGEAFSAKGGELLSIYYPEAGPLLFFGFDEHDNGLLYAPTASVYAFVDLNTGTVQKKELSGFGSRAGEFTNEFLVDTARTLARLIQDGARFYNESIYNIPIVRALDEEAEQGENPDLLLAYRGKETRFSGLWKHIPGEATTGTVVDLDGDGKDEIVVILYAGGGTGACIDDLYVFDADTLEQLSTIATTGPEPPPPVLDGISSTGDTENFYLTGPGGLDVTISKEEVRKNYKDIPMDDTLQIGAIVGFSLENGVVHCNLPCSSYYLNNYIGAVDATLSFSRTEGFRCVKAEYTPYEDNASDLYEKAKDKMDQEKDEDAKMQKELEAAQAELEERRKAAEMQAGGQGQVTDSEQLDAIQKALEEREKPAGGIVGYDQDQSNEFDKPKDKQEEEWARRQTAEYQAVGVTMDGKNYYYQGQLVNIFLDIRSNGAFYTLDTNPAGTVNVKILRDGNDRITGAAYMTEEEAARLLSDMRDG